MKLFIWAIYLLCCVSSSFQDVQYPSHWIEPTGVRTHNIGAKAATTNNPSEIVTHYGQACKYSENDVNQIVNFYKRLINVLMNTVHTNRDGDKDPYELRIRSTLTEEQFSILTKFGIEKDYNGDALREIDNIISDILFKGKQYSLLHDAPLDWGFTIMSFLSSPHNLMIIFGFLCLYLTYRLIYVRFSIVRALSILFLASTIMGFVWTWYNLVEEEEIRLMAERMQYPIPPECDAREMTWWQRWQSNPNIDCHKYVRAHNKKAVFAITPQIVIAEMFGQSFSHIFEHVINLITSFLTKLYTILPFPFNILAFPFLLIFLLIAIMQWSVLLSGVRFKLNLFYLIKYEVGSRGENPQTQFVAANVSAAVTGGQIPRRLYVQEVLPENAPLHMIENTTSAANDAQEAIRDVIETSVTEEVDSLDVLDGSNRVEIINQDEADEKSEENGSEIDEIEEKRLLSPIAECKSDDSCTMLDNECIEFKVNKKPEVGGGDSI